MNRKSHLVALVWLLSLYAICTAAQAQDVNTWLREQGSLDRYFSNEEVLALPRYCQLRLAAQELRARRNKHVGGAPAQELARWGDLMGQGWGSFHHYCWALGWKARYDRAITEQTGDQQQIRHTLHRTIAELDYVLGSMSSSNKQKQFPLLTELYMLRGTANRGLERTQASVQDFINAIGTRKDFTAAYIALSDALVALNDYRQAKEVLEVGIQYATDSESLRRRLESLGK